MDQAGSDGARRGDFQEFASVNTDTLSIQISNEGPSTDHNDFSKLLRVSKTCQSQSQINSTPTESDLINGASPAIILPHSNPSYLS